MNTKYQITVFGRTGCDKSKVLMQRVEKIVSGDAYSHVGHLYSDIDTIDGMVAVSEAECVNPKRIPAMLVSEWSEGAGEYIPVSVKEPGAPDPVCKDSRLFQHAGLHTDYSSSGKGVITPAMIGAVLSESIT